MFGGLGIHTGVNEKSYGMSEFLCGDMFKFRKLYLRLELNTWDMIREWTCEAEDKISVNMKGIHSHLQAAHGENKVQTFFP